MVLTRRPGLWLHIDIYVAERLLGDAFTGLFQFHLKLLVSLAPLLLLHTVYVSL